MTSTLRILAIGACLSLGTAAFAETIQINFGTNVAITGWNSITSTIGSTSNGTLADLVNSAGDATAVDFAMNARFNGTNSAGASTNSTQNNFGIPNAVASNSLFGNSIDFSGIVAPNPTFTLSSLDPDSVYTFTVYASRVGVGDNRTGTYTATGLNTVSGTLDASNNTSLALTLLNVRPDALGNIVFDMKETTGVNTSGNRFSYLNALTLSGTSLVPEPASAATLAGAAAVLFLATARRRRRAA